ncbi:aldehyde dehydrogenase [Thalassobacillus sp. CUG 92003]|uniref:aldehyde dehydrogenase family protein n=1 Tax=Thalassobacillus sp. CUG 92003 TaxID=2736641 RepID=UPI0015E661D7|nr:aldehyde dehydrogenase family protein [Thalassobacillus sp. CUG 92003]
MYMNHTLESVNGVFIQGKEAQDTEIKNLYNPARTNEKVGEVKTGTVSHVQQAVEAADKTWAIWRETSIEERAQYLVEAANYIESNLDTFSRLLVMEHGKILKEAQMDLKAAAGVLRYYGGLTDVLDEKTVENQQGTMVLTRQPVGVVSVIVPWNYPIILSFLMLAPSLLAGNTVVIKPPTFVPMTLTKFLKHVSAQLPDGVLNVVLGSGSTVGKEMVEHPRVRKVAFTGSTDTGRTIMRGAAETIKKVSMELGGNDAAIILKDMPITNELIQECIQSTFASCGQICYSIKRIYIHRDNYQDFVDKFTDEASKFVVGFGLDPDIDMGPINNKPQYDSIMELLERTKRTGASVKEVGVMSDHVSKSDGYFILPTIVTNVRTTDPIVQEEQFGPVIPIIPFDTEEEVIDLVNDSEFGLTNSVWTKDVDYGFKLGRQLQSGSVFVNTHRIGASAANMPFGGFKQSGIGRGHGVEAVHEHTELQALIRRTDM